MRNRMYGGVRGRKTKVGEKLLCLPPTRFKKREILLFLDKVVSLPMDKLCSASLNKQYIMRP